MKKIYYFLTVAAVVLGSAAACNKLDVSEQNKAGKPSTDAPIKLNISVSDLSQGTKAVKSGWEDGDIIHLYLDNTYFGAEPDNAPFNMFNPHDAPITYDAKLDEWTFGSRAFDDGLLKETGGYLRGIYEATNRLFSDAEKHKKPGNDSADPEAGIWVNLNIHNDFGHPFVWYDGPGGTGKRGRLGVLTAVCDSIPYTYDKERKVLTAQINRWRFPTDFQLVVTGLNYEQFKYTLYSDQIYSVQAIDLKYGDAPYSCWIPDSEHRDQTKPLIQAGQNDGNIAGVENADGVAFVGKLVNSGTPTRYTFNLVVLDKNGQSVSLKSTYTLTTPELTLDSQNGSKLVAVKVPFLYFQAGWKSHPVSTAVDLGLPSGTKWATCNIGATTPEDCGDYFAWGETEPYYEAGHAYDNPCTNWKDGKSSGYSWDSYSFTSDGGSTFTKYNSTDGKTVLEADDDAATQNWGSAWRMPTSAEFEELKTNCDMTLTTQNGVDGYKVVSKKNGASIFLPATGYRDNILNGRSSGSYWSSSLPVSYTRYAEHLFFNKRSPYISTYDRYYGMPIRPVTE